MAGLGMGLAISPILTVALSTVSPLDAPDASGLMTTVVQLGQVVGVATFGSAYLALATGPGAHPTAAALASTLVLAVVAIGGAGVAGALLGRTHRRAGALPAPRSAVTLRAASPARRAAHQASTETSRRRSVTAE